MLVTAKGEWVFEDSAEFLAELGDSNPDYDAVSFAVKNLGFIKFQILDDSIIEIELHPRNVELPALLAVQQQLLSSRVNLFRIKYFETSWRSEITFTAERAIPLMHERPVRLNVVYETRTSAYGDHPSRMSRVRSCWGPRGGFQSL